MSTLRHPPTAPPSVLWWMLAAVVAWAVMLGLARGAEAAQPFLRIHLSQTGTKEPDTIEIHEGDFHVACVPEPKVTPTAIECAPSAQLIWQCVPRPTPWTPWTLWTYER